LNIGLCREREKRWREFAMTRTGVNRDACLELADGYAYLVAVLEQLGKTSNDVAFIRREWWQRRPALIARSGVPLVGLLYDKRHDRASVSQRCGRRTAETHPPTKAAIAAVGRRLGRTRKREDHHRQ
jgi:hypothetical protein